MNTFHILGYTADKPYNLQSKTNVGYFALVKILAPVTVGLYLGSVAINLSALKLGINSVSAVYFGALKVL